MRDGPFLICPACFFPVRANPKSRLPIADFVELAEARGLIAGNRKPLVLGGFEALNQTLAADQLYAIAAKMFQQGADGLHLFNYYSMSQEWRNTTLRTMVTRPLARGVSRWADLLTQTALCSQADPAGALRLAPKCYRVDVRGRERPDSTLGFSFRNGVPQTQLPVDLEPSFAGVGTLLPLRVSDELEPAGLESVTLGLGFSELPAGAHIEIAVNGARVPFESGVENQAGWTNTAYGSGGAPVTRRDIAAIWVAFLSQDASEIVAGRAARRRTASSMRRCGIGSCGRCGISRRGASGTRTR